MKQHKRLVDETPVVINVVETVEDLQPFFEFTRQHRILGVDSETTDLRIYSDDFRCRLAQFGTADEAWVIPVDKGGAFRQATRTVLKQLDGMVLQNASFDLQVFDRCVGVRMEELWPKVIDTRILAHLIDPRGVSEGGPGLSLEDLTRHYIDPVVADEVKGLMNVLRLQHKTTKAHIWRVVPLDDPQYELYAGMDPVLAYRLYRKLKPLVPRESGGLIKQEHKLAEICAYIERKGFLLDVEYTRELAETFRDTEEAFSWKARQFGCDNIFSPEQLADTIEGRGHTFTEFTPTGNRKVDKVLLERLSSQGDEFAEAVVEAKKARKWRTTWVDGFLAGVDSEGRCHASINPLRARTARMSITGIPAQTLPAGDWAVRRCFISDPGEVMASVDYQTQELRVLAALSGDQTMIRAFQTDADLHQITADASGVDRKIGKMVNFAYVYGSGAGNIAEQGGIEVGVAKRVIAGFEKRYPKVKELSQSLQRKAVGDGFITTPFGRRLPVDKDRPYAALNYMVQSTSRDITAQALLRLHDKGVTPFVRLPIHDEVLASVPAHKADSAAKVIAQVMSTTFKGVRIGADAEVGGRSWGSLYGADY
jgi:DNA polymerase-1